MAQYYLLKKNIIKPSKKKWLSPPPPPPPTSKSIIKHSKKNVCHGVPIKTNLGVFFTGLTVETC